MHCTFSKSPRAVTAKQKKLQTHGQGIADCTCISLKKKNLFAHSLFGHWWKMCHKYFFISLNCYRFRTIFAYYAGHLPENWMVHVKLHFYDNICHVWSRLGCMNSVWPKERSMQSEFPWLWLTAAPVQCGVHAMCPGPGSSGPWSPSQTSLLLHCCFQQRQEMRLSWVLRMLHWICCLGGWSLWRQFSNDVGQHISTSMVEYYSTSFRAP